MTSLCLPTLLGWQVFYHSAPKSRDTFVFNPHVVRKHVHPPLSTDVQMFVCNKETYGYFPVPLRAHNTLKDEADSFLHCLLEVNGERLAFRPEGFTFASNSPLFFPPSGLSVFYFLPLYPMTSISMGFCISFIPFLHPSSLSPCSAKCPSDAFQTHTCS